MNKIISDEKPTPEALAQMQQRGGTWAAYQNHAMDSADLGHMQFLKVGPGCTYAQPPERMPDTDQRIGWKYVFVGMVDLETGEIKEDADAVVKTQK